MLKDEQITLIETTLKIEKDSLKKAITATDAVELKLPKIESFTEDELTSRDKVRDAAQQDVGKKAGEKEGEEKGKELVVKELKKTFGVEFEGKDLAKLTEVIKTQLAKGDDGLKEQIKLLQSNLSEKDKTIAEEKSKSEKAIFDAGLLSKLPVNRKRAEDGGLSDGEYLTLVKANLSFETVDGKPVVKRNGEILRDKATTNPLDIDTVVKGFFDERKWSSESKKDEGRGDGGSGGGGKFMKMSEVIASWEKDGKNANSAEFQSEINRLAKENPDFKLNE